MDKSERFQLLTTRDRLSTFKKIVFGILFLSASFSNANSGITYHGKILKPDGLTPVTSSSTQFRIQVRTPGVGNCLLWEEQQTKDLSLTNGVFTITIADSSEPTLIANTLPYNLERTFSNRTNFTGLTGCTSGSIYNPNPSDGRILVVFFKEAPTDPWEQMPVTTINFVPLALNSVQLEGYQAAEFLKIDPLSSYTPLTSANVTTLMDVISGTSALYLKPASTFAGDVTGTSTTTVVEKIRGTNVVATAPTTGQVLKFDGTNWVPSADATGGAPSDASYAAKGIVQINTDLATSGLFIAGGVLALPNVITAGGPTGGAQTVPVITYDQKGRLTAVTTATVDDNTKLPLAGGSMTGNINMGTHDITNATNIASTNASVRNLVLNDNDTNTITVKAPADILANYTLTLPINDGGAGEVLATDGNGVLSWVSSSAGSVTSVTSANNYLSVATTTTTPVITANVGTAANTLAAGDDARIVGALQTATYDADVLPAASCTTAQTSYWNSIAGTWACQNISASGIGAVSGSGTVGVLPKFSAASTLADSLVSESGSTVTLNGTLALPATTATVGQISIGGSTFIHAKNGTYVGTNAGNLTTTGTSNTGIGALSLFNITSGSSNTTLGSSAGFSLDNGTDNVFIGSGTGSQNISGTRNTYVGAHAASMRTTGSSNTYIGTSVANSWTGNENTLVGDGAGQTGVGFGGSFNTFLGFQTGQTVTGTNNVLLGYKAGIAVTTGSSNVIIGGNSGASIATTSNNVILADGSGNIRVQIDSSGNTGIGVVSPATKLDVAGGVRIGTETTACAAGLAGTLRYSGGSVEYCNGTSWQAFGVSGAGITSLGGQTGATQTFANGSTGTAPAFSSATNVHTLNIPLASGAGVTSGTISKTDYDSFAAKLTSPLTTKGDLLTFSTVDARLPAGADGQILTADSAQATGLKWAAAAAGTVTSVTSANSYLSIATTTTTPVITANVGTAANTLAAGDDARIVGALQTSVYDADVLPAASCTTSQTPYWSSIAGTWACQGINFGAAGGFVDGGNTFSATATLGTNSNHNLEIETNGTTRMTLTNTGRVGIGTTNPAGVLDVRGGTAAASTAGTDINIVAQSGGAGGNFAGGKINLTGGDATGTGKAGDINISSGGNASTDQVGNILISTPTSASTTPGQGDITIMANGYGGTTHGAYLQLQNSNPRDAKGGDVIMRAGNGNNLDDGAGNISISGGNGLYSMPGGSVTITGGGTGGGFDANGGDLILTGGTKSNNGVNGNVLIAQSVGMVGIGTTSPNTILDINGAVSHRGMAAPALSPAGQGRMYFDSTSNTYKISQNGAAYSDILTAATAGTSFVDGGNTFSATATLGTNSNHDLAMETNNVTRMTIKNSGNVGIGTAAPTGTFEVQGGTATAAAGTNITLKAQNGAAGAFAGGNILLLPGLTGGAAINGYVGIGTSNPSVALHVRKVDPLTTTYGTALKLENATATHSISGAIGNDSIDDLSIFQFDTPTIAGVDFNMGVSNGKFIVEGSTNALTITQATGFTGINLASGGAASTALDVNGAVTYRGMAAPALSPAGQGRIYFDSTANKYKVSQNGGAYTDLVSAGSPTAFIQDGNSYGATATLGTNDNFGLNFETNGSTKMSVLATGEVGIGTAAPAVPLQILGGNNGTVRINSGSGFTPSKYALDIGVGGTSLGVGINGEVNIGNGGYTDPFPAVAYDLKMGGPGNAIATLGAVSFSNQKITFGSTAGLKSWIDTNGNGFFNGNVGIGTTSPNTALDVSGAVSYRGIAAPALSPAGQGRIYFDSTSNTYKVSQNGGAYVDLVSVGGSSLPAAGGSAALPGYAFTGDLNTGLFSAAGDSLGLSTNGTERLAIDSSGRVGVGRSPAANTRIAVQGAVVSSTNIVASGATVDLSLSNMHLLKSPGAAAITLQNMVDGGTYTIYISDTTTRTYTFSGCTNSYFNPANGDTTFRSSYTISVINDGGSTECYINWSTGFN